MPRWIQILLSLAVLGVIIWALAAPFGPVPGVRLGGEPRQPPSQWSDLSLPHEVRLASYGGILPRVVILWVIEDTNDLFVFGAKDSGWVKSTLAEPNVDLRIGDTSYALHAQPAESLALKRYQKYIDRYQADYPEIIATMPSAEDATNVGVIFRLTRR